MADITFKRVDLPHPLRPTRQILSFLNTFRLTEVNSGLTPKVKPMFFNVYIGAIGASFL